MASLLIRTGTIKSNITLSPIYRTVSLDGRHSRDHSPSTLPTVGVHAL